MSLARSARPLLGSAVCFAIMASLARAVAPHVSGPQAAFLRFAAGTVVVLGLASLGRISLRPRHPRWLMVRGVAGGLAVLCYFLCIERVGVGVATLFNYTAPVWSLFLGWWLLGERPGRAVPAALVLTSAGVFLVAGGDIATSGASLWSIVGLASAVLSALALTAIRVVRRASRPGAVSESSWTVFASFTILGMLTTAPFSLPPYGAWTWPSPFDWILLAAMATASVIAQLLMTRALSQVTAVTTGIVHQLTVVLTLLAGALAFGERLTVRALVGSAVTMAGVLVAVRYAEPPRAPAASVEPD